MVQIFCTKKLEKFVQFSKKESLPRTENDWSGHLFFITGRKCIIFVNKITLYTVILLDIYKKDMAYIDRLFIEAFVDQLGTDNILVSNENLIRNAYQKVCLVSTDNDRKTLGTINNIVSIFQSAAAAGNFTDMESVREQASKMINKIPWQPLKYACSKDMMIKMLAEISNETTLRF